MLAILKLFEFFSTVIEKTLMTLFHEIKVKATKIAFPLFCTPNNFIGIRNANLTVFSYKINKQC